MNAASGWRFLPVSVAVIALDQFTKLLVVQHFKTFGVLHVLPVLDITLRYNTGAAFSFLAGASGWQRWLFIILALAVAAAILIWMRRLKSGTQWLLSLSLALILAGALGNVRDTGFSRFRAARVKDRGNAVAIDTRLAPTHRFRVETGGASGRHMVFKRQMLRALTAKEHRLNSL